MFKLIAEAYEILSNPETRRNYDMHGHNGVGVGMGSNSDFSQSDSGETRRNRDRRSRSHYSDERAFNLFNRFFEEFESMHLDMMGGDPFFEDPFFSTSHRTSSRTRDNSRKPQGQNRSRDPFGDPFFSGFGLMGGMGMMGGMDSMMDHHMDMMGRGSMGGMSGMQQISSFSSMSSGGGRMQGTSTSTTTVVGADGVRRVRKETTTRHADGRTETKVEEYSDDSQRKQRQRLGDGSDGIRRIPISAGGSNGREEKASTRRESKYR
jgi:curved DNA-binding protein CbpA